MESQMKLAMLEVVSGLERIVADPAMIAINQDETTMANLKWMCDTLVENLELFPEDKINRWVGFIQGVLAAKGCLLVKAERDRTRPLFHAAYNEQLIPIPVSISR